MLPRRAAVDSVVGSSIAELSVEGVIAAGAIEARPVLGDARGLLEYRGAVPGARRGLPAPWPPDTLDVVNRIRLTGVALVDLGLVHSCAVKSSGSVWCWGPNDKGQLGDNTTTDRPAPVAVVGSGGTGTIADATTVAAGQSWRSYRYRVQQAVIPLRNVIWSN